ncbi:O-antigen ligase family protein [Roseicella frigidaeris]|uniref:O-antigen ligase family protein n=1 Tax=Roseicella frigidaeris TaxID=2230885 RepID=UPI001403933C|nr:O-antigen ligase family protein [Roseicella frigidaeris]
MRPQPTGASASRAKVTQALIALSIVLVAFNDLVEFLPLGEIAHDAFIVIFPILALRLMLSEGGLELPQPVARFTLAFTFVVLASIALNYGEISHAFFKGRSGMGRILTQSMILAFGVLVIIVYHRVARLGMTAAVVKGARGAILVMAFMGVLEFASWYSVPGLTDIHTALANVVHSDSGPLYVERLRMTAFEVSWAGALLSFFLPFAVVRLPGEQSASRFYAPLALVLVILAQSRTAMLVVGFQFVIVFWAHARTRMDKVVYAVAALGVAVVLLAGNTGLYRSTATLLTNVIEYGTPKPLEADSDENTSNITRSVGIRAALSMFKTRPLFGVGFGQFGYHYTDYVRADDLRSWEVREYIDDGNIKWPPSYSIHARLLSETGIAGYLVWLGFVGTLTWRAFRYARNQALDASLRDMHFAVGMTLIGVLLLGLSIDSFRFFGGWIAMGIGIGLPTQPRRPAPDALRRPPLAAMGPDRRRG